MMPTRGSSAQHAYDIDAVLTGMMMSVKTTSGIVAAQLDPHGAVVSRLDIVTVPLEQARYRVTDVMVVVDHENSRHHRTSGSGSSSSEPMARIVASTVATSAEPGRTRHLGQAVTVADQAGVRSPRTNTRKSRACQASRCSGFKKSEACRSEIENPQVDSFLSVGSEESSALLETFRVRPPIAEAATRYPLSPLTSSTYQHVMKTRTVQLCRRPAQKRQATENLLPRPASLSTSMSPPWRLAIPCATERPSPVPSPARLVV